MTPDPRPTKRAKTRDWDALRREKLAVCRVCGSSQDIELHHLVARSLGGDDVADNLVPLCHDCHTAVEKHAPYECLQLQLGLTDLELAYITEKKYAGYAERRYGGEAA